MFPLMLLRFTLPPSQKDCYIAGGVDRCGSSLWHSEEHILTGRSIRCDTLPSGFMIFISMTSQGVMSSAHKLSRIMMSISMPGGLCNLKVSLRLG